MSPFIEFIAKITNQFFREVYRVYVLVWYFASFLLGDKNQNLKSVQALILRHIKNSNNDCTFFALWLFLCEISYFVSHFQAFLVTFTHFWSMMVTFGHFQSLLVTLY